MRREGLDSGSKRPMLLLMGESPTDHVAVCYSIQYLCMKFRSSELGLRLKIKVSTLETERALRSLYAGEIKMPAPAELFLIQHGRPRGEYSLIRGISTRHVIPDPTLIRVVIPADILWNDSDWASCSLHEVLSYCYPETTGGQAPLGADLLNRSRCTARAGSGSCNTSRDFSKIR